MTLTERSVRGLLAAFRSSDPTPGGGSASALSGAIGASLLTMVARLPKPVASTTEDLERLGKAGTACEELASHLEQLVDRDSEAYDLVVAAYKLPKSTDEEKAFRATAIQHALRTATEVPLAVMRACQSGIGEAAVIGQLGNSNASSDVLVGVELLRAGFNGAKANVDINVGSVRDQAFVDQVREEIGKLRALLD